jgi:hypothetical protein
VEYFTFKNFLQSPEAEAVVGYVDLATDEVVHVCESCRAEERYTVEDLMIGFWFSHEPWCPYSPPTSQRRH